MQVKACLYISVNRTQHSKLTLSIVYFGLKHIWGVLWLRHSLQLRSSHKLSLFLSLSLALFKSITNIAIKAMNCLDVPNTDRKVCVSNFEWDRWWQTMNDLLKKKKKKIVQVQYSVSSPQVHLFKIDMMKYDSTVDTLHHLQHRFSPPWDIRPPYSVHSHFLTN